MIPFNRDSLRNISSRKEPLAIQRDLLYIEATALVDAFDGDYSSWFNHYGVSVVKLTDPTRQALEAKGFVISVEPTEKHPHRWKLSWE
nr:MAG TPA: hypothetical protein [Caudoviricetes sp.]